MQKLYIMSACILLGSCSSFVTRKEMNSSQVTHQELREIIHEAISPIKEKLALKNAEEKDKAALLANSSESEDTTEALSIDESEGPKSSTFDPRSELHLDYSDELFTFWINYFSKKSPERFTRFMVNGDRYKEITQKVFKDHNLPEDLFFVGFIESGFNNHAKSHASAVGPWQFIKGTAKRYGLRVDKHIDERRNIHKSTVAAAGYFRDLYNIFGSWELALCAYNAGEYRIINAIRKGNTRDYKELVRKKLIPKETIYYVPKVAAAREIFMNPHKYNLKAVTSPETIYEHSDLVEIGKPVDLRKLSKHLSVSLDDMKKLNPDILHYYAGTKRGKLSVVVPKTKTTLAESFRGSKKVETVREVASGSDQYYYVQRGDSLYSIAKKFGTTIRELKAANGLTRSFIYKGQKLVMPDDSVSAKKYVVRNGDNLYKIARKFKTSVKKIVTINSLKDMTIYRGQELSIPQG
ncbi:transglycosylase SLT domain protein [Bacteriovorax sp. BSW11_IV]|uniref:lytic transglycosylase domain-containing protein n=1 Tax=Bacteriovorax sp. BSW11_IV TaxID=1353529 RepID=UPI000389E8C8|nr:lytic transglycosylase domain-containing protein [Bacteriovorax sp. BSW11_IV]EQC49115.1 transglycosylase SLT domain protein [Bacteriovorax sp. BSW11_IV]